VTLALLALSLAACPARPRPPNVLWIVWDTVRADRLGLYGHGRDTTPNLDRWAAGGRVFERCLSVAGYTLPAHASMFTGLLPSEHCAHNDHARLDDAYVTIAELLQGAGYRTYLYSANPHISADGNFDQGFDVAEHPWSPRFRERAERLVRDKLLAEDASSELGAQFEREARGEGPLSHWNIKAAGELAQEGLLSWLGVASGRPWFAFLNYMEAHRPLVPARGFRERMMSPEEVGRSFAVDRGWLSTWEYTFRLRDYTDEELALTGATYDAALAELDTLFGRLIAALEEGGWLDDTVVVLTSDHGEHLGEQHMLDHQYSLYQPLLHVPLVLHFPARVSAGREERPVASFDLFPTLLELTGVAPPTGLRSQAASLLHPPTARPRMAEDPAPARVPITMVRQAHADWNPEPWERRLRALIEEPHKLIVGSDGRRELYDLAADPLEQRDLVAERPEVASRLERALESRAATLATGEVGPAPPELTPEQIERLKALGYLGG
jgi:arylsulfatase A-like enzyme